MRCKTLAPIADVSLRAHDADLGKEEARGIEPWAGPFCILAEAVRFELTMGFPTPVFKTGAIDHSATLPWPAL